MIGALRIPLASLAICLSALPGLSAELVMVEQAGCAYCARWNAEIGPIYPKTSEGAYAPLRRVDLRGDEIETLTLERRVVFTPTFILVDDTDTELARLEGYPGEDFFWGLLEQMLQDKTGYTPAAANGG
ncbi:hypothetical protein [Tropicimonas marinistellae]|uniref:hypothetical protein n=1 Tax=Tropicimonas marinistellae TaxID=1739787 RepID=UPI000A9BF38D|nr:hypothetical protein [Tropicimonas marinistellae]